MKQSIKDEIFCTSDGNIAISAILWVEYTKRISLDLNDFFFVRTERAITITVGCSVKGRYPPATADFFPMGFGKCQMASSAGCHRGPCIHYSRRFNVRDRFLQWTSANLHVQISGADFNVGDFEITTTAKILHKKRRTGPDSSPMQIRQSILWPACYQIRAFKSAAVYLSRFCYNKIVSVRPPAIELYLKSQQIVSKCYLHRGLSSKTGSDKWSSKKFYVMVREICWFDLNTTCRTYRPNLLHWFFCICIYHLQRHRARFSWDEYA